MSGLIWAGIGQGIANAGRTAGDFMMRGDLEEERQREKAELQRERLAATERENERNRQLRAEMAATAAANRAPRGGGDGGLSSAEIGEGGADEGMLARRAAMTVPELRALRKYSETGDTTPFQQDVTRYKSEVEGADTTDAVSRKYAKEMGLTETVKELPPGFEAVARAKLEALAKIEESFRFGGKYNELTKGRENQFGVDMARGVIGGNLDAGRASQAVGVMGGKPMVDIKGDTEFSPYIAGQRQTTDVGKSVIAENQAQAGQASAAGRKSDADAARINDRSDPETMRMRSDYTQRERTLRTQISKAFGADKEQLQAQLDDLIAERKAFDEQVAARKSSAPTAAPSGGGLPEPKTPAEVAKLKPGTRFKAPDGSIRYR